MSILWILLFPQKIQKICFLKFTENYISPINNSIAKMQVSRIPIVRFIFYFPCNKFRLVERSFQSDASFPKQTKNNSVFI